jgi:catechol 1,2-dioxygenase
MSADPRTAILGTWRLVHSVEFGPGGEKHYPFGEDAIGYIIYTESGVMAVQMTRRVRATARPKAVVGKEDYLAYFGHYELDVQHGKVRHLLEGELFPGGHSEHVERKYHFFDDMLSLKPLDGTNREILWQRV